MDMLVNTEKLMRDGCAKEKGENLCRARGGESCAFDGAMIVLQPIADTAHIVHGPIACCGNSWEGRGSLSSKGDLHKWGFTTDLGELDIVYGAEEKLYRAILHTNSSVSPSAIFVHATCVSGLIGEDIEAVCRRAEKELGIRVIPVNAPGFIGPKHLGNRIAGEVLLENVIGTGELSDPEKRTSGFDINLIGEYNIAGDQWQVEPVLKRAGIRVLARITGDATFEEITRAHHARLNVVVCSRALINVAKEMERKYGIPFIEVSFFGKTEMTKALRAIKGKLKKSGAERTVSEKIEKVIGSEERRLEAKLGDYMHLKGKKAVLYSGGVKSWSFISALMDLGIEVVAIGSKKSTREDEEKMKEILGPDAPLVEDVSPKNLLRLLREHKADMLVAGGRNKYLAVKEGYPFIDINQERHRPYAGYDGLINIAEDLSCGMRFYEKAFRSPGAEILKIAGAEKKSRSRDERSADRKRADDVLINPLKHSRALGAAIAFQGIHRAVPVIHGAQGCNFLGKVLLTSHFREPIAMVSSRLFVENVVMGSEEAMVRTIDELILKSSPEVIGILTTGLSEVKGDDVKGSIKTLASDSSVCLVPVSTPDYEGGLETGFADAVEAFIGAIEIKGAYCKSSRNPGLINVLAGSHLTPADFAGLRETAESFGLRPIMIPDLAALDGSRKGISALALGGTTIAELEEAANAEFTLAVGASMERPAAKLKERFGTEYRVFESLSGMNNARMFLEMLSMISGKPLPARFERQERVLADAMRDAQFYFGGKRACIALEPDHAIVVAGLLDEMGAVAGRVVIPQYSPAVAGISASEVIVGGLDSIGEGFDILISNSHAAEAAKRMKVPLYQVGFPVNKILGVTSRVTIGYKGTLNTVNEIGNLLINVH
jgi:nitrogenase molybdenum-cofactor synthesis protein NifE